MVDLPMADLDEPLDPKLANRPLEPGSGAPDLNAIMKRVRDERGQPVKHSDSDASKSDFIAAARRAAQAAAAEADALKRQSVITGPVRALRIGDLLKARRKPILMATTAITLALAGTLLGKAFLSNPDQTAGNDIAPIVAEQKMDVATANPAPAPVTATQDEAESDPVRVVGNAETANPESGDVAATTPAMAADPAIDEQQSTDHAASAPAAVAIPEAATPNGVTPDSAAADTAAQPAPIAKAPSTANPDTTGAVPPAGTPAQAALDIPANAGPEALRQAAAEGDAKALFEVGSRYAEARGVKEDLAAAAKWYEKSAELGFAPAEYRIGNFYEKGLGVTRDIQKAKTWYQLAAGQGNASAMHNLAVLFAMAADGVTDNESAARWVQAAADLGVKDSQFNLGILAAKGVGMKQNLEEAYKWFALVAKTGDKDAASKRDEIANALRPEQLEHARATTELWKAKPLDPNTNSVDIPESWHEGTPATTAGIDMKKAVQNIQRILNKNGYDAGGTDGVMGQKTKNAIMAFQGDNDMQPTGEVDEKLVKALLAHK
jgi:localization factor PodJL